jgi:hypothetical protein
MFSNLLKINELPILFAFKPFINEIEENRLRVNEEN